MDTLELLSKYASVKRKLQKVYKSYKGEKLTIKQYLAASAELGAQRLKLEEQLGIDVDGCECHQSSDEDDFF